VLIDKIPQIKTVVNKLNEIDNTYRNFAFEILAGENNTLVSCKENTCEFKFDFAKVYWNPRLSTEHERVVKLLNEKDVLYDVFAGVGPFSVPAASNRKLSAVLCNDLNPESYRHLLDNYNQNNKSKSKLKEQEARRAFIKTTTIPQPVFKDAKFKFSPSDVFVPFNMDGRDFIRQKVKYHLIEILNYRLLNNIDNVRFDKSKFYVLMNLPALSLEFLDSFNNLYDREETELVKAAFDPAFLDNFNLNVFCYHFCKGDATELKRIQENVQNVTYKDADLKIDSKWVRKVAPSKDMFCSMFKLQFKHLFYDERHTLKKKLDDEEGEENAQVENPAKILKAN
jgi:tRNA (guanine37-N1)-methyltransferase